jgi:hypothetical protein
MPCLCPPPFNTGVVPPRVPRSCTSGNPQVAPFCFVGTPARGAPNKALHQPEGQPGRADGVTTPAPNGGEAKKENAMNNSKHLFIHAVTTYKDEHGQEQTRWTRIGAMFPNSKGGARIVLDFIPRDPNVDLVAMPPREREDG